MKRGDRAGLLNPEVEHDRDEHIDGCARETPRLEAPLHDCSNRLLIQTLPVQRSNDAYLRRTTFVCHDELQHDSALNLTEQCVARIRRLYLGDHPRRAHGSAWPKDAAASSAAGAGPDSGSFSWPDALPYPRANAATHARAGRCTRQHATRGESKMCEGTRSKRLCVEYDGRQQWNFLLCW